jgi:Type II secretion system (T2SS), protein E, N-terminal domain
MPILGGGGGIRETGRKIGSSRGQNGAGNEGWMDRVLSDAMPDFDGAGLEPPPRPGVRGNPGKGSGIGLGGLVSTCANPECASGWLHLWRSRSGPIFEGGWSCSAACTLAQIESAVRREMEGRRSDPAPHRHRVPLGLVMLEQGWITPEQLRRALDAQKAAGQGKLGKWLMRQYGISEQLITRALSLQWSCPVLPLDFHDPLATATAMPRLFLDAFGALPLRVAAGRILYLGFEDRLDPVVALAAERMLGLRVEVGLVRGSQFGPAQERMLDSTFPPTELIEAVSEQPMIRALAKAVERAKPVESRLVRVHDCLWLRMWLRPQAGALPEATEVEDVVCSLGLC